MDFYIDPTTRYPLLRPTRAKGMATSMRVLEEAFDPTRTQVRAFRNVILVSIDLEYCTTTERISQIGIATLDTRDVNRLNASKAANVDLEKMIKRQCFLLRRHTIQRARRVPDFLYGFAESAVNKNIKDLLLPILVPCDDFEHPRNVILVGHNLKTDIAALERYGDMNLAVLPSIKAFVDTSPLLGRLFSYDYRYTSLERTCKALGICASSLHNAGNDALYTLQALLLLFHHYKSEKNYYLLEWVGAEEETDQQLLWKCQLDILKRVARACYRIHKDIRRPKLKDKTLNPLVPDLLDSEETDAPIGSIFGSE